MAKAQKVRVLIATLVGGAILLLILLKLMPAGVPSRFDYIHSQASSLGFEQERIISFVRDEVAYQKYDGVLRGAVGTLWGARGNSFDQAILLHELLQRSGLSVQYAGSDEAAWVQVQDGGSWIDIYPVKELEGTPSTWTGLEIPPEKFHRLEAVLLGKNKPNTEEKTLVLRTADLAGGPLILKFAGSEAKLALDGDETAMVAVPIPDESLAITFRHFRPGIAEPMVITREFYSKLYTEYKDESNSKNTHVIAALPCRVPQWVYDKEAELSALDTKRFNSQAVVNDYLLTLTFMRRSDQGLGVMEKHFETAAVIDGPRIIIASTLHGDEEEAPPWRTLDLRSNGVRTDITSEKGRSLAVTRSVQDADLEAWVLRDATGVPVISGFGVMGKALGLFRPSTPERLRVYSSAMENFLSTSRPGARLTFGVHKDRDRFIDIEKIDADALQVSHWGEKFAAARDRSEIKLKVLAGKKIQREQIGQVAWELETLFGPVAGMPTNYQPAVEIAASTRELLFDQARIFTFRVTEKGTPKSLTFEYQMLSTKNDVVYESVDYWNEELRRKTELRRQLRIPAKFLEECSVLSHSYSQNLFNYGTMFLMSSKKTYRELKEKGQTVVRYRTANGRLSEPFRLYVCDVVEGPIYVNNQRRMVKFMRIGGGYEKDKLPKQAFKEVKDIKLDVYGASNKWHILDNEDFPLMHSYGARFQTSIPGRVTNERTGAGVPDAEVVVEGTASKGNSWGDGQFELPIIQKRFGQFVVTAKRRGYQPLRMTIDFTKADAFPLELKMKPKIEPDDFLWISAGNIDDTMAKVDSSSRTVDNIRRALRDNPKLIALVPRERVPYHAATVHAWVLFEPERYQFTAVTEDGLHGVAGSMIKDMIKNAGPGGGSPYDMQQGVVNYYAGFIASWYVYSAGKLEALSGSMDGKDFSDLGHAHAIKFAKDWLKGMGALFDGASGKVADKVLGVKGDQYKEGFKAGLSFFEKNPEYRGK